MPDVGFGGNVGTAYIGWAWVRSDGIGLPSGLAMANGSTACLITAVGAYVVGRGAARTISLQLGSASTGGFVVGAASHPPAFTGYVGTNAWLVNGGSASLYIYMGNQLVNFGRSSTSGGANTYGSDGSSWSGTLGGAYRYAQAPSQPTITSLTSTIPGRATLQFSGSADNGGAGISTYRVQYSHSATFTGTVWSFDSGSGGPHTLTGLQPGQMLYARVAARNAVTDAAGTVGPWSAVVSRRILSGAYFGVGGTWKPCEVYYGLNGEWVPVSIDYGNGTAWTPTTSI